MVDDFLVELTFLAFKPVAVILNEIGKGFLEFSLRFGSPERIVQLLLRCGIAAVCLFCCGLSLLVVRQDFLFQFFLAVLVPSRFGREILALEFRLFAFELLLEFCNLGFKCGNLLSVTSFLSVESLLEILLRL